VSPLGVRARKSVWLFLALLTAPVANRGAADENWQPSVQANEWNIRFSPGMPEYPKQDGDGWRFSFPQYEGRFPCEDLCPSVGYVTSRALGPLRGRSITMKFEIIGPGIFEYRLEPDNTCWRAATVRLLIQRRGDDFTKESYRWWSDPDAIILSPYSSRPIDGRTSRASRVVSQVTIFMRH
jgi:hypothetical protein